MAGRPLTVYALLLLALLAALTAALLAVWHG